MSRTTDAFESAVQAGLSLLRLVRQETDAIGVAVSFGKDSLATLDLACRVFPRVEGYYLYRVPGLRCVAEWTEKVRVRFGVTVRMYPHFDLVRSFRHGVLLPHYQAIADLPRVEMKDIENQFRRDVGVEWLAMGWRRNDSFSRALIMRQCRGYDERARRVFPLRAFSRGHVLAYLESRRIKRPPTMGREEQGGLDFDPDALTWLQDHYPDDYARWCTMFPFTEAWRSASRARRASEGDGCHSPSAPLTGVSGS